MTPGVSPSGNCGSGLPLRLTAAPEKNPRRDREQEGRGGQHRGGDASGRDPISGEGAQAWTTSTGRAPMAGEPYGTADDGYARRVSAIDVLLAELDEWAGAHGSAPQTHRYGSGPEHEADLLLGAGHGPHRVAVLLHGGFWGARYTRTIMGAMAVDLARRGWATWNVEYRRVGSDGGAQQTIADVRAAIDAVRELEGALLTERLLVIGHSAGGQLALCAAAAPAVAAVVSLAGVCDLVAAAEEGIGDGAVVRFIGAGPQQRPEDYALADPLQRLPTGVPVLLVHGDADTRVPVHQSRTYAAAAQIAGDRCELVELTGVDHFALIDPRTAVWAGVADRLPALLG